MNGKEQAMSYTHDWVIEDASIDDADARVRTALAERCFCVLTEIDIKAILKASIGVEVDNYRILGA